MLFRSWKKQGLDDKKAGELAAKAAKEFAISKKKGSMLPGAKGAAPADLQNVEVAGGGDSASKEEFGKAQQDALGEALKKWQEAFGGNKTGDTLDKQSADTKSAQERAQANKTQAAASKLAQTAQKTSANANAAKPMTQGAIPLNSTGERPSADINPFLRSQFGVVSQANYAPQNIVG